MLIYTLAQFNASKHGLPNTTHIENAQLREQMHASWCFREFIIGHLFATIEIANNARDNSNRTSKRVTLTAAEMSGVSNLLPRSCTNNVILQQDREDK